MVNAIGLLMALMPTFIMSLVVAGVLLFGVGTMLGSRSAAQWGKAVWTGAVMIFLIHATTTIFGRAIRAAPPTLPPPPDLSVLLVVGKVIAISLVSACALALALTIGVLIGHALTFLVRRTARAIKAHRPRRLPVPYSKGIARPSDLPPVRWRHLRRPTVPTKVD